MAISPYIYGLHDAGGESHMGQNKGWIVWTKAIGTSGSGGDDYSGWSNQGYGVIVRLNNGYEPAGTLPVQSAYPAFAQRCADYVRNSPGVDYWIIGNECNLPREWPQNVPGDPNSREPITVSRYVDCYKQCHAAIKAKSSHARICPAPCGTYAPPFPEHGVPEGFVTYWIDCLKGIGAAKIDGLILHAYTHGHEPQLVTSEVKMGPPYEDIYYHFFVYKNLMEKIPLDMRNKPVLITECNQVPLPNSTLTWKDENSGWVREVYKEINRWNATRPQKIMCVALFRWEHAMEGQLTYSIRDKHGVIADFKDAVALGYRWGDPPPDQVEPDPGYMIPGIPSGTNLATNTTAITDSIYGASYTGQQAVDGVTSHESKWVSADQPGDHWLALDLGTQRTVTGFVVRHASSGGVDAPFFNTQAFKIQSASSFDGPWTTEAVVDNAAQAQETSRKYLIAKSLRYVRLYITDPGPDNIARIPEFEVWGQASTQEGPTIKENFETMPPWSSEFDAAWGGPAKFKIAAGGRTGNCLRAKRVTKGSSSRVRVFDIAPNTDYRVVIWMCSPGGSTPYWAECAFKLGEATAADFDGGQGWTIVHKFANPASGSATNGNQNVWTKYTKSFSSFGHTKVSVGFKLGSQTETAPVVKWDALRIKVIASA